MTPNAPDAISCERVLTLLLDYLEDELSVALRMAMDDHLRDCEHCVEFLREYQATSTICREELRREMPEELRQRLVAFIQAEIGA